MVTIPGAGIPVSAFDGAALITAAEGIGSNNVDTAVPTAAAVKAYVDPILEELFLRLNSANVGANVITAQDVFPVDPTLEASTVYEYELFYALTKSAGATSHTVGTGFGGTATINNILRHVRASFVATAATTAATISYHGYMTGVANTALTTAIAAAAANVWVHESGTVSINAGGTFIPQYTLSAAPGGAYSTVAGSFFRLRKLGASGANNTKGTWA